MYEYRCAHCGKRFEVLQKFSDAPVAVHEECGSGPVERLISAPAFSFKGTGWYVTDYAKGNGAKNEGASSSSKSESKSDSKSDSGTSTPAAESTPSTPSTSSTQTPATTTSNSSSNKSDK